MMKRMKKLSALAAGSIAIGLLLGTSLVQAQEVCYDGDIVTGIKGLDVFTETHEGITIDVDFVNATGFQLYGPELKNLPFGTSGFAEEDSLATVIAINLALNGENPVPDFVEISGKQNYYIGAEGEVEMGLGLVGAVGGENVTGENWEVCDESSAERCIASVAVLPADDRFIYADLRREETGGSCTGAPPPDDDPPTTSYTIVPCISGSWYLPARDGEGYNIEIIGSELDPQVLAYFYTYDDAGNQMWVTGYGPANGDTAIVPVEVFSGPVYGDDYDKGDLDREDWGTLTFTFTTKDAGTVERKSTTGFGTTTVDIVRLTSVTGLECP